MRVIAVVCLLCLPLRAAAECKPPTDAIAHEERRIADERKNYEKAMVWRITFLCTGKWDTECKKDGFLGCSPGRRKNAERACRASAIEQVKALPPSKQEQEARARIDGYRAGFERCQKDESDRASREQMRVEQRRIETEEGEAMQRKAADPKWMRPAYSAALCAVQFERRDAYGAIASEKKYSRIGGAVKPKKLYDLQQEIREADEAIKAMRALMKERKISPMPCKGTVAAAARCINGERCETDEAEELSRLAPARE